MLTLQVLILFLLLSLGLATTLWVFAPLLRGAEAARRDLGSHQLALGSVVVVFLANALLLAPVAPLLRGPTLDARAFIAAALATQLPMLLVLYLRVVAPGAASWWELGLRRLPLGTVLRVGIATGIGGMLLTVAVAVLLQGVGLRQNQLEQFAFLRGASPATLLAVLGIGSVLGPFVEELFFRGFVFGMYLRRQPTWLAYGASSLLFALLHVNPRSMDLAQGGALVAGVFSLGLLLAWTYRRTGSLLPGMVAHGLNNTIALTSVYATSLGH